MSRKAYAFWAIFVAAALVRVAMSAFHTVPDASSCLGVLSRGTGTIIEDPSRTAKSQVLIVLVDSLHVGELRCAGNIRVRVSTALYPPYSYGDRIELEGKLVRPFNFFGDTGREFDYRGYLAKDDIYYEMKSAQISHGETDRRSWDVRGLLFGLKRAFVGHLQRALGEPHAALASGLVVGEKASLGKDLLEDFRTVGLIHIVVLSGFNITIVGVAMRRMLSFLPRVWGIVVGGVGIALFGVLVGGGATVVRSCFMAGVALIADLIRRDYSVGRALVFAGLVMIVLNPLALFDDPSFQLSFLATLGLILLSPLVESRLGWLSERFGLRSTVSACLATQIFVSPYILYTMGQISVIGIFANILVLPFIPFTMLAVFLTGALGFIHPVLSQAAGWCAHLLLSYELEVVELFAGIPYAGLSVPPFSPWWVVGFYVSFLTIFILFRTCKTK